MTSGQSTDDEEHHRGEEKAALEHGIKTNRRAVLVVNTRSRRGAGHYSEAKRRLVEKGWTLDAAYPVRHPERMPEIVREAITRGHKFIIIGGGDGTISSVVDHFAYADVVFGILPLGTANSFARMLSIPLQLDAAVDVLSQGKLVDINLGKINDDYFANGAAIGLPAILARSTPHSLQAGDRPSRISAGRGHPLSSVPVISMHADLRWALRLLRCARSAHRKRRLSGGRFGRRRGQCREP